MRDVSTWRALIEEYARLERLEGHTPQSRGQRFNGIIAELLANWGISASANERSKGEIDVGFTHEGVRYVLEAKWEKSKADTGDLAKLHKRVQQRLSGTRGVFLAMSGFTPEAIADLSDGQRLEMLLLDRSHWEAMLSGLVPPPELLTLASDHAAFRGDSFAPLATLLARSARLPKVDFDIPARGEAILESDTWSTNARFALSVHSPDQLGVTCISADELLLTTTTGIVRANVGARTATPAVEVAHCHRRAVLRPDGSILFTRRLGVGRLHKGRISTVAGGAAGATCLVEAPDGTVWLLDNGELTGQTPASVTRIGTWMAEQERHDLTYPNAMATNAVWVAPDQLLVIGAAGFQKSTLAAGSAPLQPPSQANPMGLVRTNDRVVLTSGDGVTIVATDLVTGASVEVAHLALRGPISELTRAPTGELYLAAYDCSPSPGTFAVVRLHVAMAEDIAPKEPDPAPTHEMRATTSPMPPPEPTAEHQLVTAPAPGGRAESATLSAFDQAVSALTAERKQEQERGYRDGVAFAPSLGWPNLASLAERNFDLKGWLESRRTGWLDVQMGRAPSGAQAAGWLPALADLLGSLVDVIGYDQWSFTPSNAYVDGFTDGLRAVWNSSAHDTSAANPTPRSPGAPARSSEGKTPTALPTPMPPGHAERPAPTAEPQVETAASRPSHGEIPVVELDPAFVTVKGILGSINFDGKTVTIRKQGHGPRMKGVQALPVDKIEKVIVKPATAMFHGYIQFVVRELPPAPDRRFSTASGRPHREDPDSMSFPKRANNEIEDLRRRIEAAIAGPIA